MSLIKEVTSASSNGKYKVARVQVEPAKEEQVFTLLISLAIILIQNVTGESLPTKLEMYSIFKKNSPAKNCNPSDFETKASQAFLN